ncbi:MAG: hypothetical protein WBE76_19905 [Terracidiphilus sp.]
MKKYYYNPKTQDLMIFDTEHNEIDVLEVLKGIHVITSSEIRGAWSGKNGSEDFNQEAPVKVYKKHLKASKRKCGKCGNGTVLFPRTGCEELLGQVFNLGVESHDDLCDGLTTLLQGFMNQGLELPKIHWIDA